MKKLNITKKQYNESKYFNKKYGSLKYVSENGKMFKTSKGVVLALEGTKVPPEQEDESLADIGAAIKKSAGELKDKVVDKAKAAKKAIGDAIKGPFRKGDQIEMSNSEGDKAVATVTAGTLGGKEYTVMLQRNMNEADEEAEEVTRGELADMLAEVVDAVKEVADSQDVPVDAVLGVDSEEDEADEADADEVVATKEEVAEVLAQVIDTVAQVADKAEVELPVEVVPAEDAEVVDESLADIGGALKKTAGEWKDKAVDTAKAAKKAVGNALLGKFRKGDHITITNDAGDEAKGTIDGKSFGGDLKIALQRDMEEETCPDCKDGECDGKCQKESRARRVRARKVLESVRRRARAKKVLESIRRRARIRKIMESRKAARKSARKVTLRKTK